MYFKKTMTAALLTAAVAFLAPQAEARTFVVFEGGSIQAAIDQASPGDEIVVRGRHAIPSLRIDGKSGLRIRGVGRRAGLDSSASAQPTFRIEDSDGIVVERLTILAGSGGAFSVERSTDVRLHRNHLKAKSTIPPMAMVDVTGSTAVEVSRSVFKGSMSTAIALGSTDAATDLSVVARNRFKRIAGVAVHVIGEQNLVLRNRVRQGRSAILVDGPLGGDVNVIRKNRMNRPVGHAVRVNSGPSVVAENSVRLALYDSIVVDGESHAVTANKVKRACRDGLCVLGSKSSIVSNKIVAATDDGIVVLGDENLIRNNDVRRSGDTGVEIDGDANILTGNDLSGNDTGVEVDGDENVGADLPL